MPAVPSTASLAADTRGIDALRAKASTDPKAAVREVSKQFEALFMQELMKSMRAATPSSGLLDNAGTQLGTEMLDTQFATQLTGLRGGLSDAIARQLERQMGLPSTDAAAPGALQPLPTLPRAALAPASAAGAPAAGATPADTSVRGRQQSFVARMQDAARAAESQTGIPANFMVAQAAHETGWGRHEIRNADGTPSYNVFGIKAGPNWSGPVAQVTTTEYINGQPRKVVAKFRAYGSYDEAFQDYARLMKDSPRYSAVVANASSAEGFARGLQRAGYATDPAYAEKLTRMINTTLRVQRGMA